MAGARIQVKRATASQWTAAFGNTGNRAPFGFGTLSESASR